MTIQLHTEIPSRQRSARNDPSMLDGDSGHGNPGEPAGDLFAVDTDTDVGDAHELEVIAGEEDELPGVTAEALREFHELREEVADRGRYSDDEAVDATILSQEREALGDKKEEPTGVVQPSETVGEQPLAPPAGGAALPLDGYESLTVKAINERARGLQRADVQKLLEFEKANRNRKSLVAMLDRIATGRVRPQRQPRAGGNHRSREVE